MSDYSREVRGYKIYAEDDSAEDGVRYLDGLSFEELKDGRFLERAKSDSNGYDFEADGKDYTLTHDDGRYIVRRRKTSGGWF